MKSKSKREQRKQRQQYLYALEEEALDRSVYLNIILFSYFSWQKEKTQFQKINMRERSETELNITNLSSLKERRTRLCRIRKYIQKMSQNDYPINFLKPRTATSGHSYNPRPGGNNRNNVYAVRSCCRTQRSGSFISFASKYVNMWIVIYDIFIVSIVVVASIVIYSPLIQLILQCGK